MTDYQLRRYEVKPGAMGEWLDEWRRHVVPLRRAHGFEVLDAWVGEDGTTFTWILAYEGEDGYAAADARYYSSPERTALDPDPARHLARVEAQLARRASL